MVIYHDPKSNEAKPSGGPMPSPEINAGRADDPQWMKDLLRDGYAVIKGVIPRAKAQGYYAHQAESWLEGFDLGYQRNNPKTWKAKNLPRHENGGLYLQYSMAHAQFVWDAKTEPGVVDIFERLWGTRDLTVSFDGANLSVPLPSEEVQGGGAAWPHSDQSPSRPQRHCIQGLLNLLPNGPEDGGLALLKGSANLFEQYFAEHPPSSSTSSGPCRQRELYTWQPNELEWFYARGCKWVKPSLDPGDFVLWDSRSVHLGGVPKRKTKRFAIFVCYKPLTNLTPQQRARKTEAFARGYCTTADPCDFFLRPEQEADWNLLFPYGEPILGSWARRAVGLRSD